MKKTVLTLALVAASMAAFAQGKVKVVNDGASAFTLSDINHVLAADAALAGQPIPTTGPLPSGKVLEVGLYYGATAGSLSLATIDPTSPNSNPSMLNPLGGGSGVPGVMNGASIKITGPSGVPAGTTFFQVKIWDSAFSSYEAEQAAGGADYLGQSAVFSMTPGPSITYPSVLNGGSSTWAAVGNEAPILVGVVPEPATFALAGLGAAAMLIFRRRK